MKILKKQKEKFQLKIPSKTDNLELIRTMIAHIAKTVGFDEDDVNKIELAVDEACANVIKHAYYKDTKDSIDLIVEIDYKKLTVIITDQGIGFDVKNILNRDIKNYLAQMKVGGLGIHLMKALMDEVEFKSKPGIKTEVKMVKYFVKDGKVENRVEK
ncbi:MAG TPA: ATP-binding protein [bacterium]|nr:ATP-binding protein [bacterium]